jgi:hypothetical protein
MFAIRAAGIRGFDLRSVAGGRIVEWFVCRPL